jgi:predicted nucleic acid-binding protein
MSQSKGWHALHAEQASAAVRPEPVEGHSTVRVLDTNIVLDLWVFDDPRSQPLLAQLERGDVRWLATAAMREELARVLTYPHIARRLQARGLQADAVLGAFDRHAQMQPDAPKAPYTCKDADDQKFIDLAVRHGAALHSKDAEVLCMKNRLARCGVVLNPPVPLTVQAAPTTVRAELVEAHQEN